MAKALKKAKPEVKRDSAASQERILIAATKEFSEKGYDGARVDAIALSSQLNKNALYHYFGSKEKLFIAVLERAYATIRDRQSDLSIRGMDPEEGMRRLVEFTAKIWVEMPEFNRLLASENLHEARHVKQSKKIPEMYNPLLDTIKEILKKGADTGKFRDDVDPTDLYISITALSAHYISHRYTFEAIFNQGLMKPARLQQRIDHAADMIIRYLEK
ncbi:MAG TPA: TetR/AcrR family transcriptional regulator [Rhodospirillaceae bacterium]|jgi:TetR/AcrR family transcriptional regulator|nr:TetR family transcriptional regulator [Rhodospirillaceae bacterium]MAX62337.1 TetR family transcriptional regulator [Rhodospirillaceae bacterium]MBB56274.1 TetR family transcriptional regulator [Rhodospirillaceae bacterium]HAE03699.1 TetR/AcrR family transcriptional regulator [Rhodospirillaceae bacterium]HAJ19981.1 TetR/AcrR family transcriptional regulator [Rhodospirillaceae bacterium]|tara:strand:+ start:629 stop:1276 length:648 start_codon:yes stop_codon:yes gene_type:complete